MARGGEKFPGLKKKTRRIVQEGLAYGPTDRRSCQVLHGTRILEIRLKLGINKHHVGESKNCEKKVFWAGAKGGDEQRYKAKNRSA